MYRGDKFLEGTYRKPQYPYTHRCLLTNTLTDLWHSKSHRFLIDVLKCQGRHLDVGHVRASEDTVVPLFPDVPKGAQKHSTPSPLSFFVRRGQHGVPPIGVPQWGRGHMIIWDVLASPNLGVVPHGVGEGAVLADVQRRLRGLEAKQASRVVGSSTDGQLVSHQNFTVKRQPRKEFILQFHMSRPHLCQKELRVRPLELDGVGRGGRVDAIASPVPRDRVLHVRV